MINLTINAHDGNLYELTSRYSQPQSSAAQPYRNDPYLIERLIARLPIEVETWLRILGVINHRPATLNSYQAASVHQAVANAVVRGDLVLYKLPLLNSATSLRGKGDIGLCIIKGPKPHCSTQLSAAPIASAAAAQELLNELGIEPKALLAYLNNQNLYNSYDQQSPLDEVLTRLANSELLAYKIPLPPMSVPEKAVQYAAASGPGYEPVPLAPESSSSTAAPKAAEKPAAEPVADAPGKNPAGETSPPTIKTCTGGEPISLVTGEELLELHDFTFSGLIAQTWTRTYRSSNRNNVGLGIGWSHPLSERLSIANNQVYLLDGEGRTISFVLPRIGDTTTNRAEKLRLFRLEENRFFITSTASGSQLTREFFATERSTAFKLIALHDALGNSLELQHDQGALKRIVANDLVWVFDYHPDGNIAAIHQLNGQAESRTLVNYHYDGTGDLILATDAAGKSEYYAYKNHLISKRTLKTGYSFHFEWDSNQPNARCLRNWGDNIDGQPTYDYQFEWDKPNRRVTLTDTRGGEQIYQFNAQGLPIYHRDAEGGETRTRYDRFGNVIRITDPIGAVTEFRYDNEQRLQSVTNKAGHTTTLTRDAWGNVVESKDPNGHSWAREFDERGLIASQTNPNGETTRYQYNTIGLVSSLTDPLDRTWHFVWDHQGKLIARKDPKGHQSRYTYDDWGNLLKITWPDNQISEYRYDNNGKCTAIKQPDGKVEQFNYNELGLLSGHKDSTGRITRYEYNGLSQVVKRIDPNGQVLHYHYDGERNLVGLTNEKGERYQLDYDLNERLIQEIGFDGRVQRYGYNPVGQLQSSQDFARNGIDLINQIDYTRSLDGRLLKQSDAIKKVTISEYEYDAVGRLTSAKNDARELSWKYDSVGRVIEDKQDQHQINHVYNAAGERIQTQLPDGEKITYSYNANSQFSGMAFNQQTIVAIAHDSMGRELKRMLGNQLETEYRYDPQGRLAAQRTGKRDQDNKFVSVSQRGYQYNAYGQLAQIDDHLRGTTRYHYDALDRLTQVDGPNPETFVHDPAGNILGSHKDENTNTQQQSNGNRLAFYGDNHYRYDERGNRTVVARGKQQSLQQHFAYNALNQLESVENQQQKTSFQYDALGRRVSKVNAHSETQFLWLDNALLSETTTQANNKIPTAKIYLFEPGTHKPLAIVQDSEVYHYHLDHLGTPQEITNSRGKLAWSASFKAYGNLAVVHNNEIENNLRFQGQYYDEETGLHYNRFRYYDPECGRFISQDPIGLLGGVNNYQYVPNPTGWVDPLGLSCKEGAGETIKNIQAGDVIIIDDPSRLAFTDPKPSFTGTSVSWNLYDKVTGAVITEYVKASSQKGPDMYLRPHNARIAGIGEVKLVAQGFSWTEEALRLNLEAYEKVYGVPAPNLDGELAEKNMDNFQKEFVRVRKENEHMTDQDVANEAIRRVSFGNHREKIGYGDFNVIIEESADITVDGVKEKGVPTWVSIEAKPSKKK
ncbi:MAG TPA: RHS repeat-associated core domain-containing protein [Cellvibrio sp.]|nr:RHS repeat-associated core domain-containing protein [Cellvibrio sp.]